MLAEHLAALDGWSVEALTTYARDAWTWANEYEPGTTVENGVTVHRFATVKVRDADFRSPHAALARVTGEGQRG